jgi:DDE_Tnp_1-associated/Transposase DDE domain
VHLLTDILIIAILSVIPGDPGWEDMQNYGLSKYEWLSEFLKLPEGIACPDTFRRVFERINPLVFEQCFRRETVNDQLKNISQIVHSRHRSVKNFMVNQVAGLIACTFQEKKPSLKQFNYSFYLK